MEPQKHIKPQIIQANQWVNPECSDYQNLKIFQNIITAQKRSSKVFSKHTLSGKYTFSIQIKSEKPCFGFGIADKKNVPSKYSNGNIICLFSQNQDIISKNLQIQKITNIPNIKSVTVTGNMKESSIQFKVNGKLIQKYQNQQRINDKTQWVPYIWLSNKLEVHLTQFFSQYETLIIHISKGMFNWDDDLLYEINNMIELGDSYQSQQTPINLDLMFIKI